MWPFIVSVSIEFRCFWMACANDRCNDTYLSDERTQKRCHHDIPFDPSIRHISISGIIIIVPLHPLFFRRCSLATRSFDIYFSVLCQKTNHRLPIRRLRIHENSLVVCFGRINGIRNRWCCRFCTFSIKSNDVSTHRRCRDVVFCVFTPTAIVCRTIVVLYSIQVTRYCAGAMKSQWMACSVTFLLYSQLSSIKV